MSLSWSWVWFLLLALFAWTNLQHQQVNLVLVDRLAEAQDSNLLKNIDDALKQQHFEIKCEVVGSVDDRDLWGCESPIGGYGESLNPDVAYARALLHFMEMPMHKSFKEFLMDDSPTRFEHDLKRGVPFTEEELVAAGADKMFDFDWEERSNGPLGQRTVSV